MAKRKGSRGKAASSRKVPARRPPPEGEPTRLDDLRRKWLGDEGARPAVAAADGAPDGASSAQAPSIDAPADTGHGDALSWEQIEQIVRRDLPGHEAVRPARATADFSPQPESVSPDVEAMRRKYWPADAAAASPARDAANGPPDRIVVVRPEATTDAPTDQSRGPGLKVAVISGAEKKVIGMQG